MRFHFVFLVLKQKSAMNPPGTLAYITEEEALLVRVNKGWQYIAVSDLFLQLFLLPFSPASFLSVFASLDSTIKRINLIRIWVGIQATSFGCYEIKREIK